MLLKFCGLCRAEDIEYANEVKPDYVGFVFAPSRRQVTDKEAYKLKSRLNPDIQTVGVFVNEPLKSLCKIVEKADLDVIQLHGDESEDTIWEIRRMFPDRVVWKAVRVRDADSLREVERLPANMLLFDSFVPDSYGGSGQAANWSLIAQAGLSRPFFLAGGLGAGNLAQAIAAVHPAGVDVSGGIETDGIKDLAKMKAVREAVRRAASEQ